MRFSQRGGVDDMNRAIGLLREALTLRLPGNSSHDTLNTLALPLQIRYDKLDIGENPNKIIDLCRDLLLRPYGHPYGHATLHNLVSVLCSHSTQTRKNDDVKEVIRLPRLVGGFAFTVPE